MPPVVAAVSAYVSSYAASFSLGGFLVKSALSLGANLVLGSLSKKPKAPDAAGFGKVANDRTVSIREPVAPWSIIDGSVRVRGVITHLEVTGSNDEFFHIVYTMAGHQVAYIGDLYADGVKVPIDGAGEASGTYAGYIFVEKNLGPPDQAAFADLVAKSSKWTTAHRQRGRAGCHVRLKHSASKFPNGVPNITFDVDGRYLFDPRDTAITIATSAAGGTGLSLIETSSPHGLTVGDRVFIQNHSGSDPDLYSDYYVQEVLSTTTCKIWIGSGNTVSTGGAGGTLTKMAFSDNAALIQGTYLTDKEFGQGSIYTEEINATAYAASANTCDEEVAVTEVNNTFTAATDDECTQDSTSPITLVLGDKVTLSTTDTLPAGLSPGDYYVRPTGPETFKLSTNRDNALNRVFVDITDTGTGTHTITRKTEPRYTARGVATVDQEPHEIIGAINSAMAGNIPYIGGEFHILAGEYRTPTVTLDEGDLRAGDFEILSTVSRREAFNAVKGVYAAPQNRWQPADYPVVTNATYEAADGEKVWHELDLAYTTSPTMAQRLAKIELERARQEITIPKKRCKLSAFDSQALDVVNINNTRMGWSTKPFEIASCELVMEEDKQGNPILGVDMGLRETASAVWDWSAGEETTVDPAPNTNLPDPLTVAQPTSLALASGTTHLFTKADGTVISRIKATWTAPADEFVTSGGVIQVWYKKTADSDYDMIPVDGAQTFAYLQPVDDGVGYSVYLVAINGLGVPSDATSVATHTVVGKTADPSDVTSLIAQQNGDTVLFKWPAITDADRAGYAIKYAPHGSFVWEDATPISEELIARGTTITTALMPPGSWTTGIKAQDTSGNQSTNATTTNLTVSNANDVVLNNEAAAAWGGTLTNMLRHHTGVLVPDSQNLASDDDWETFDQYVPNPYASCSYEMVAQDLGFDADGVRVWADIVSVLGPGETTGNADPTLSIDYRDDAASYDGFKNWTVGSADFRHIKSKITVDTSKGLPRIDGFNLVCDVAERSETHDNQVIASGGTTITFNSQFHSAPVIDPSVISNTALYATYHNVTTTSVDIYVWNSSGTDVGGTVKVTATGP